MVKKNPSKDLKYAAVAVMIEQGKVKTFTDVFRYKLLPKSKLVKDLGISSPRLNKLLEDPSGWMFIEIHRMALLFETDTIKVFELIFKDFVKR